MSKEKWPGLSYDDDTDMGADAALLLPESMETVRSAKSEWAKAQEAGDQKGMDYWHGVAEGERAKSGYSGGENGGGYIAMTPTVKEPDYGTPSGEYKEAMDKAIQALQGRGKFTYDPETDPSFQQYKDQYTRLGKQAMEDSFGHAAMRTGGLGGSAAMTASQQAYNGYMKALADKIPELRQIAYQMYKDEEDSLRRDADLFGSLDQQQWNRWNTDRDFKRGAFETDRSFDYNKGVDQWNMVRQLDRDAKADAETEYQHGQDERNWQWQQSERDYEQALDKAATLASVGDFSGYAQLWGMTEEETQALVAKYAKEQRLTEEQAARDLADWYAGYGDYSKAKALGVTPQLKATGGSRSGGSGGEGNSGLLDVEDIYQLAMDMGGDDPVNWIKMNYKSLGIPYNSTDSVATGFQRWIGKQMAPAVQQVGQTVGEALRATMTGKGTKGFDSLSSRISRISPGVTADQMENLVNEIDRALADGTITHAQYDELGRKLGYQ